MFIKMVLETHNRILIEQIIKYKLYIYLIPIT